MKGFFLLTMLVALFSIGCRNTPVIPESPAISFSNDIQPILAGNCQRSGCHGSNNGGNESRARPLDTYSNVMSNGEIEAFNAHGSALYERVINAAGYNIMPPSPNQILGQQQLLNIYLWIMQGAQNN